MKLKGRKLLSAAVGVATVSYVVACGDVLTGNETSGNLPAPPPGGAGGVSGAGGGGTGGVQVPPLVGNLPSPPPFPPVTPGGAGAGGTPTQVDAGDTPNDAAAGDAMDSSNDTPLDADTELSDASD